MLTIKILSEYSYSHYIFTYLYIVKFLYFLHDCRLLHTQPSKGGCRTRPRGCATCTKYFPFWRENVSIFLCFHCDQKPSSSQYQIVVQVASLYQLGIKATASRSTLLPVKSLCQSSLFDLYRVQFDKGFVSNPSNSLLPLLT